MTIDISGDVIYFDGRPVGFITVPNGSLRGDFEEALTMDEWFGSEVRDAMKDFEPFDDFDSVQEAVDDGKLRIRDEVDTMCKILGKIYDLIS